MASLFSELVEHSGAIGDKQCAKQSMNEQGIREALPRGRARQAEARKTAIAIRRLTSGFVNVQQSTRKRTRSFSRDSDFASNAICSTVDSVSVARQFLRQ